MSTKRTTIVHGIRITHVTECCGDIQAPGTRYIEIDDTRALVGADALDSKRWKQLRARIDSRTSGLDIDMDRASDRNNMEEHGRLEQRRLYLSDYPADAKLQDQTSVIVSRDDNFDPVALRAYTNGKDIRVVHGYGLAPIYALVGDNQDAVHDASICEG